MIKLYTERLFLKNRLIIEDINLFFNSYMNIENLTEKDKAAIQAIDAGIVTDISQLSTGCKTIILLMHIKDSFIVYIEELNNNCIDYILDNLDDIIILIYFASRFITRIKKENLVKRIIYNDNLEITEKNLHDCYYLM